MEKTMRRAMETMKNSGADLRPVVTAQRQPPALRASCRQADRSCSQNRDEPGRNSHTLIYAISTNGERAQAAKIWYRHQLWKRIIVPGSDRSASLWKRTGKRAAQQENHTEDDAVERE